MDKLQAILLVLTAIFGTMTVILFIEDYSPAASATVPTAAPVATAQEEPTPENSSFEAAKKNPELREIYLKRIVEKVGKPDYVTEISYIDTPEELEALKNGQNFTPPENTLMSTRGYPFETGGMKFFVSKVWVFPSVFGDGAIQTERDFIITLFHEYNHAKTLHNLRFDSFRFLPDFLNNESDVNQDLLRDISELEASRTTFLMSGASLEHRYNERAYYLKNYGEIWNHEQGMDPKFIKALKTEYLEPWMVDMLEYDQNSSITKKIAEAAALKEENIREEMFS